MTRMKKSPQTMDHDRGVMPGVQRVTLKRDASLTRLSGRGLAERDARRVITSGLRQCCSLFTLLLIPVDDSNQLTSWSYSMLCYAMLC